MKNWLKWKKQSFVSLLILLSTSGCAPFLGNIIAPPPEEAEGFEQASDPSFCEAFTPVWDRGDWDRLELDTRDEIVQNGAVYLTLCVNEENLFVEVSPL